MPSLLQQQVQQVSATWGTAHKRQRGKASLLYTAEEAADVDLQTVFEIAQEGLEQLCMLDTRFETFQTSLFSQTGLDTNRDGQTQAENNALDATLEAYLQLLTNHFLSAPAFQTLEFLIRKYRVHECNVEALVACGLPYHATNHFVRLVQVVQVDQTIWRFLSPMQKSGAAMPRTLLVQRCANDQAVLQAICEKAKAMSGSQTNSSSMQSFYAVLLCELLTTMQPIKEDLVRLLLPYIMAGLGPRVNTDYNAATLMIVTLLASKATLSEGLLTGVLQEMAKNAESVQVGQVVMVLCHIAVVQPQLSQVPKTLFKRIVRVPDFLPHLERLAKKGMAVGPLLAWLLPHLAACLLDKRSWMECAMQMVKRLPLGIHAQLLASAVLQKLPELSDAERQSMTALVRALDLHFPEAMDAAVNQLLQQGQGIDKAAAEQVLGLVQTALAGSAHAPLAGAHSTLALAVDAPSAEMRILALKELDAAQHTDRAPPADDASASNRAAFMQSVLLRRLTDDEPGVLAAALSLPSLKQLPSSALYEALAGVLDKYRTVAGAQPSSSIRKAWRSVAQKVLSALDSSLVAKQPSLWQAVMLQLLDKSLIVGHSRPLALAAINTLKQHTSRLLSGLSAVNAEHAGGGASRVGSPDTADELAPNTPNRPHKNSKEADLAFNHSLINALAEQLAHAKGGEALAQAEKLFLAADHFPHARHLLLLALVRACCISKAPAGVSEAMFRVLRGDWATAQAAGVEADQKLQAVVDDQGLPVASHFKALSKKPARALAAALPSALLVAIQSMPAAHLQSPSGDLAVHSLCAAVLALRPVPFFQQHCQALLDKVALPAAVLSNLFGAPTGSSPPAVPQAVQERALELLPAQLSSTPARAPALNSLLPRLLAAASLPHKRSRQLAVTCLGAAASAKQVAKLVGHATADAAAVENFVTGLVEHATEIVDDEQGLVQVVRQLLSADHPDDQAYRLTPQDAAAIEAYLLHSLAELHSSSSTSAALVVLLCTSASPSSQRLQSAVTLLQHLPIGLPAPHHHIHAHAHSAEPLTSGQVQLVTQLMQLFTAPAFSDLLAQKPKSRAAKTTVAAVTDGADQLLHLMRYKVEDASDVLAATIRQTAYQQVREELYAQLPVHQQIKAFLIVLNGSSRDPAEAVRGAARGALACLPITAASLAPLLADFEGIEVGLAGTPAARVKTRKRAKSGAAAFEAVEQMDILQLAGEATGVELCVSVLELLQWKEDVQGEAQLLDPLSQVLRHLLTSTAASQSVTPKRSTTADAMDTSDEEDSDASSVDTEAPAGAHRSSNYGYAMALALQAVHNVVSRATDDVMKGVDTGLILECARQAPDSAVRNAALALLAVLASKQPDKTFQHVLEVIGVVGSSASQQQDSHSHQVAASTLAALVPAWLQAGKSLPALTAAVVAPLAGMLPHRRLPLLLPLLAAVPEDAARPMLLLQLLQQALLAAPTQKASEVLATAANEGGAEQHTWSVELANAICQQASMLQRVEALTALLQQAVHGEADKAAQALSALAVTFAASQIQECAVGVSAARSSAEVQAALAALLEQAVTHLQLLGTRPATSKQERKAHKTAEDASSQLLDGLAKVMDGPAYVGALLKLVQHPSEAVVRRALRLITGILARASQTDSAVATAKGILSSTAEAAVQLCSLAPVLLQTGDPAKQPGPATRQAALVALSQIGQCVGQSNPEPILKLLPSIVAAAQDVHRSVRSSALAAAAACLLAVGSSALPLLPTVVPAIVAAAQAAVQSLPQSKAGGAEAFDDTEGSEAAALEAASALAAVGALVEGLKAFLSPQLGALLQLLFSPQLLACKQAGCSEAAAGIRIQLAAVLPPRLLLAPLFGYLDAALQEGEAAAMSLLAMVQHTVEQMDATTAAQHADACYTFLLGALDTRQRGALTTPQAGAPARGGAGALDAPQRQPPQLASVEGVEQSSVAVLLALTMKLSEAKFKPLFLRLLDWASTAPAAQPDAKPLGRQVALFSAVLGLAERLRSVFVPYFRYLMDPIAAHLGGSSLPAADGPRQKRKKRSSAAAVAVVADDSDAPAVVENTWRLRLKVVQALHSCFRYDTVSFLDEARFHRLLPLLVQQLSLQPPVDVAIVLQPQQADSDGQKADVYGDAVVAALVQMAVTANSDALWKPLNHQALMTTRSSSVEDRLRALAAVSGLVSRMQEEYLLLLPEALPFLAELLEDPEHEVVRLTQQLIKKLEELSGESLEQYLTV